MHLPSALAIAILMALASNAEAHDPTDLWPSSPLCHETDADEWLYCRIYDGDIPAKADPAPVRVPCPSGYAAKMNCYEIGYWDEAPTSAELAEISWHDNRSRDAVVIRVDTHYASGVHKKDLDPWWHHRDNHHRSDGDRNQPAERQDRTETQPSEPPAREPNEQPEPRQPDPEPNPPMMGPGD